MKRIILILLIVILVLIGVFVAIPILFKNNLLDFARTALSQKLQAKVEMADLKISLIRSFPKAGVSLNDLLITGYGEHENDTLFAASRLETTIDLASLFHPSGMEIESVLLEKAVLRLKVDKEGGTNWQSEPASDINETHNENAKEEFQLKLGQVRVRNSNVYYNDESTRLQLVLDDIDFDISGNLYGNGTQLQTTGSVAELSVNYGGISYISKTKLEVNSRLEVDFEPLAITLAENEILVNRLPLEVGGTIKMPSDSLFFDLQMNSKQSDFEHFLALTPPVYEHYLKDFSAHGNATVTGAVSGYYLDESYPAFSIRASIAQGSMQYTGMKEKISNISANIGLEKPQGELDLMRILIQDAHAEISNNPVDFNLELTSPVSDLTFNGSLKGKVDLAQFMHTIPLDSVSLSGVINADLVVSGKMSDVDAEAYDKVHSDGRLELMNFIYESPQLTQSILVPQGTLDFLPQNIRLNNFRMQVGESDFKLAGTVSNYLNYLLKEGTLTADLQLDSKRANLNQLFRLKAGETPGEVSSNRANGQQEESVRAFDVPKRMEVTFRSNVESALINRIPIRNMNGLIRIADQKLTLQNLSMNMLDGQLRLNGSYVNSARNQPFFDFGFQIKEFDIPTMFRTLSGFKKMVPGANNSTGRLNSQISLKGQLNEELNLISSTANGKGTFSTHNLEIIHSPVFNKLGGIIKKEKLENVTVDDFVADVNIENGNILLEPFKTKVIGQETTVAGNLNAENLIDMRLDFMVEREAFGPDIQKILAVIPGNEKIKILPAGVVIKGPVGDPKVSPDLSKTTKAVAEATKDDLKNSLDKLGKGILKLFER